MDERGGIRIVKLPGLNLSLLVVISSLQDRSAPFSQQPLRHALNTWLGLLASGVEENDFADATTEERLLFNIQLCKGQKDVALNVVGWKGPVVQRLEEELDMLQKVCIRIKHRMLYVVSIQDSSDFGEQLQLVESGLAGLASLIISLACAFHLDLKVG